jgi:ketosteroid isomerase-like protein
MMQRLVKAKKRHLYSSCSFVSFVVGLCFLAAGCAGSPKHPSWNTATGANEHERLMWQAVRDKDWANFERHLSPTFIGVNADGQMFDRAGWIEHWKSAQVLEFSLGEVKVQPEGPDMKVTYIFHLQGSGAAPAPAAGLRVVSVWQQVSSRWVLTATSITPILKEP